jgi:hypothetical protein
MGKRAVSAEAILKQAADYGVEISLNGDNLALDADTKPPASLLANIKQHKAEIITRLRDDPALEQEAAMVAAELAIMNAVETKFQKQLEALRADNARVWPTRTAVKLKRMGTRPGPAPQRLEPPATMKVSLVPGCPDDAVSIAMCMPTRAGKFLGTWRELDRSPSHVEIFLENF